MGSFGFWAGIPLLPLQKEPLSPSERREMEVRCHQLWILK